MKFIVSEKKTENGTILVITDGEIVGKLHQDGKKQLDLGKKIYQGEEKSSEEIKELIDAAYILHLTGQNSVDLGIKLGLVDEKRILIIKSIPHAEVVVGKE